MAASEGAMSLTDPDATIENPFHTSRPNTPEAEPEVFDSARPASSEPATTHDAEAGPSQATHDPLSPSFNRFSFVSLTSTADRIEESDGITTGMSRTSLAETPTSANTLVAPSGLVVDSSPSDYGSSAGPSAGIQDRFLSRTAEQENKRVSTAGMEILKENFERIHRQSKRHTRTASEMTSMGGDAASGEDLGVHDADATIHSAESEGDTTPQVDDSDDVDWDFWGRVMNSEYRQKAKVGQRP